MRRWIWGIGAVALAGCALPAPGSHPVVVTASAAVVANCPVVGDGGLEASQFFYLLPDRRRDEAVRRLKNRAAELGGTHVLSPIGNIAWKGADYSAKIHKCG